MIYLDNSATTPISDNVKNYIISILDEYGNPSSRYNIGLKARRIIEDARCKVSEFINADPENIIFTSSGSAANTLAIKGISNSMENYHMFYSPIAHKSMLLSCQSCKYNHPLKVDKIGMIDIGWLKNKLYDIRDERIPIVCLDVANSEIGTIQNIDEVIKITHMYNGIVIGDFTGYIPSYKLDVKRLDIDIATFSAHKLHALKGVGILYKKNDIKLTPLVYGSQEQGLFGGTENIIGIGALGESVKNYNYSSIFNHNRDYVYNYILNNISDTYLVGASIESNRLPNNLYMCFKGIDGEALVSLLDMYGIAVSTGSACNSGSKTVSPTLLAIGMDKDDVYSCIRFTFSGFETREELDYVCKTLKDKVELLRKMN